MFDKWKNAEFEIAEAHCDGPCGVYDPSQARVEAESVLQLTKKILDLRKLESIEVPVFELPAQAIESLLMFDA